MKSLIYNFIAFTGLLFLISCESFIDLQPLDQIGNEDYWKTSGDLENYTKQFYPRFHPYNHMIWQLTHDTDDLIYDNNASVILNGKRSPSTGNWRGDWYDIRSINFFFDNYKRCEDDFNSYKHFVGEAHFFRAWFYFKLLVKYGDVPYYSTTLGIDDEALFRPRDSRTLVADSILHDLDLAAEYLSLRADLDNNNTITKEAALAFKTRVALFEGTWQKYHANTPFGTSGANPNKYLQECVSAAEELMNGNYTVGLYNTGDPDNDYYRLFGFDDMGDIDEVILYRAFSRADNHFNTVQCFITRQPRAHGITWDLVTSYLGKDGEPYNYWELAETHPGNIFLSQMAADCDPRLKSTVFIPGDLISDHLNLNFNYPFIDQGGYAFTPTGFQVKKTHNPYSPGAGEQEDVGSETGLIILRYGEVLLNYAEAKYELDNSVAYNQLNLLRQRAGMPDFQVHSQTSDVHRVDYGYSISDELYAIRRERHVELALEGHRHNDLLRWRAHELFKGKRPKGYPFVQEEFPNVDYITVDEKGLIDYYHLELPNGYQFREGQDYLNSIPQDELTLNPALQQNPGW